MNRRTSYSQQMRSALDEVYSPEDPEPSRTAFRNTDIGFVHEVPEPFHAVDDLVPPPRGRIRFTFECNAIELSILAVTAFAAGVLWGAA